MKNSYKALNLYGQKVDYAFLTACEDEEEKTRPLTDETRENKIKGGVSREKSYLLEADALWGTV